LPPPSNFSPLIGVKKNPESSKIQNFSPNTLDPINPEFLPVVDKWTHQATNKGRNRNAPRQETSAPEKMQRCKRQSRK
jgi:hypothetical protein